MTRRFGWDCHGLPVEYEIDKKLEIKGKEDVLRMGIDKYNEECRAIVMRYSKEWERTVKRVGAVPKRHHGDGGHEAQLNKVDGKS